MVPGEIPEMSSTASCGYCVPEPLEGSTRSYPPYQTCHRRSQRWIEEGVLGDVLEALAEDLEERGEIDFSECYIVLQCHLYIGYEATASSPELEHFHYALPETFLAPLAVATIYRSPRPELLFR
jgi:hypothetical protein